MSEAKRAETITKDVSLEGLSDSQVLERRKKYGLNVITQKNQLLVVKNLVSQFSDLLVIILLIAGTLSWVLGDMRTAQVMYAVVLLNAGIGFWQQYKTEKIISALKNLLPQTAKVVRGGIEKSILASEIVPDDVLIIQAGDAVPADGEIIEAYSLKVNESSLTGESNPQTKHHRADANHPKSNLVFMGTTVLEGQAKVLTKSIGSSTEFGKIAEEAKSTGQDLSPLQKKLKQVGKTVSTIAISMMLIMIIYQLSKSRLVNGEAITPSFFREVFLFGLALGAALVPEGLPATVSVALSLGASRLAKKNAVVKKLSSVETLGGTQVICTDKTGTLTYGKMSLTSVWPTDSDSEIPYSQFDIYAHRDLLINWASCHNIKLLEGNLSGNPNEIAIYEALIKKKINPEKYKKIFPRVHEFSFNAIRKMMSVILEDENGHYIYAKGSPQVILDKCRLKSGQKEDIMTRVDFMAKRGIRVLAFAHRELIGFSKDKITSPKNFEKELIFDGLIGIKDDIRPEAMKAVNYCHKAGIRIIMITGDYKVTAEATGKALNLSDGSESRIISGEELYEMNDLKLRENLLHPCIFYQTDPRQKFRIVDTLQKMELTVAVTGDGVNDALALKKADIGIAMGKSGTDVAKEAADMILLDDNFATIVNAVIEGRTIWGNLKKFLFYVLSSNAGEFMTAFLGVLLGLPLPITAVQVLSVDLGTDVLPSLALAADKESSEELTSQSPNHKDEVLLNKSNLTRLLYVGIIMGGGAVLNFWLVNRGFGNDSTTYSQATSAAFATLVVCQIVNVISINGGVSNIVDSLFKNRYLSGAIIAEIIILMAVLYWPPIQGFLATSPLSSANWLAISSIGLLFFIIEEIRLFRSRHANRLIPAVI